MYIKKKNILKKNVTQLYSETTNFSLFTYNFQLFSPLKPALF